MNATRLISAPANRGAFVVMGALGAALAAPVAPAQDGPPTAIELTGVVRDMLQAHVDFDVIPADGYGHFAGNVALTLDADGKPVFTGEGFRVVSPWRDAAGRAIAPHLFNMCGLPGGGGDDPLLLPARGW